MPNPAALITAYPPNDIKDYLKNKHTMNIYIDLKNVMHGIFIQEVGMEMIQNTIRMKTIDSSIFQSCLHYAAYWKRMAKTNNKQCNIFFATDIGKSMYHCNILSTYKESRGVTSTTMAGGVLDERVKKIRDRNFEICEKHLNRIPNIYFFLLRYLESDFLSHYLINKKVSDDEGILHIICSGDKDLIQSIDRPNIIMIYKCHGNKRLLDIGSNMYFYSELNKVTDEIRKKRANNLNNIDMKHIPAIMALVGDKADDVPGVDGIGIDRALDLLGNKQMVESLLGTPDQMIKRIHSGGSYILEENAKNAPMNNMWRKVLINNSRATTAYKLISFDMLVKWLESGNDTFQYDIVKYINRILEKEDYDIMETFDDLKDCVSSIKDFQIDVDELKYLYT
jgi:hypothetical protein